MVNNEAETPAPSSGATAQAATSSNRPVVMLEAFLATRNKEWDSWLSHFEDCAVITECNDARKAQFLAVRMRGATLLQLQSLSPDVRGDYTDLKRALREKFVPKERIELHKAEFRARRRERDEKLPDLASSLSDDSSGKRIPRRFLICNTALRKINLPTRWKTGKYG